jgi:putative mRNA 3-end processing factor
MARVQVINGVQISLHPAGHVLGSAQVRLAHRRACVGGVGRLLLQRPCARHQPTCTPFEPVRCDCFITESTFGLPIYRWRPQAEVMGQVNAWWQANASAGRASLLLGYSFGKAQRLLAGVDTGIGPIFVHKRGGAAEPGLPRRRCATAAHAACWTQAPTPRCCAARWWWRRLQCWAAPGHANQGTAATPLPAAGCNCGARRRQGLDRGFVLSDHADWPGLQAGHCRHRRAAGHRDPRLRSRHGALAAAAGPAGRQLRYGHDDTPPRLRPRNGAQART